MTTVRDDTPSLAQRVARSLFAPAGAWPRGRRPILWGPLLRPLAALVAALLLALAAAILAAPRAQYPVWLYPALAVLVAAGVTALGLLVYRVQRDLLEPLGHIRDWALRVRNGNLSARIPLPQSGEFAALARDINSLGDELKSLNREMSAKVRKHTQRLSRKTRSLEILYEVAVSLNTSRNLDELLSHFLETFMELVDARAASVRLLTEGGQTRLVASRGLEDEVVEKDLLVDTGRCACGWAASGGGIHIQQGTQQCAKLIGRPYLEQDCHEFVVVPMQYQDRIVGVYNLFLNKPSADLGDEVRDLLTSLGRHLGLAVEKARLDDNARRLAIIEERNMMGNELHDSLAQSLVSMRLHIKMLGEMLYKKDVVGAEAEVRRLHIALTEANASLRELLANFRSRMDEGGLVPAIEDMVLRFEEETGITALFHNECSEINLSPAQEIQVFRIIQEALANIRKHSDAHTARIMLRSDDGSTYGLLIEDDGQGMAPVASSQRGEHVGLSIMRERAQRLPGTLAIESEPGEGTRISVNFMAASPKLSALPAKG